MPKTKISEYSATANSNTDVASINIDEGCAPSGINNAIRAVMGHLKDFQSGTSNDPFTVGSSGSLTLSYGTANGVAYLNGSKVLTTGSALVFDGTNLRVGTTSSLSVADKLTVVGGNFAVQRTSGITTFMGDNTADGYAGTATNQAFALLTNSVERARIDTSGNFGIGTSSPTGGANRVVDVYGSGSSAINFHNATSGTTATDGGLVGQYGSDLVLYNYEAGIIQFGTSNAERARIDSSGNLLVGTTSQSASERFNATNSAANSQAIIANATSSSFNGDVVLVRAARNTTNSTFAAFSYYNDGAAAYKLRIWDSGNVVNTNNSYGAISDAKLKENIVDATPKLEKLNQVRVVNFNFIGDQQKQLGVVAQELEQIFPSMIDESPDKDAEGNDLGTTTKSVKYSVFVPMLIKAIQEQQAIIQSLTARITALESA